MSQPKGLSTYVIFSNFWDGIHALKIKIEWETLAVHTHLNLRVQNDLHITWKYTLVAKNMEIFCNFLRFRIRTRSRNRTYYVYKSRPFHAPFHIPKLEKKM